MFEGFKALADRKKELFDGDIEALVLNAEGHASGPWTLGRLGGRLTLRRGRRGDAYAAPCRRPKSQRRRPGDGPIDAAFKAVEAATGISLRVRKFEVRGVTEGRGRPGRGHRLRRHGGRSYRGVSVSTNIVEGGVNALLEVINRIELAQRMRRANPPCRARRDVVSSARPSRGTTIMPIPATKFIWFNGELVPWE